MYGAKEAFEGLSAQELNALGNKYADTCRWEAAKACYERSLTLRKNSGDLRGEGLVLNNLGALYHRQGRFPEALVYYQRSLDLAREAGEKESQLAALLNQALVYFAMQEREMFLEIAAAKAMAQELRMWEPLARMRWLRGRQSLLSPQGYERAMAYFAQALVYAHRESMETLEELLQQVEEDIRRLAEKGQEEWAAVFCDYLLEAGRRQPLGEEVAFRLHRLRQELHSPSLLSGPTG